MPNIEFASSIQRYAPLPRVEAAAMSVEDLLEVCFTQQPALRSYVLDDQGAVRKHVTIFVNDKAIGDRTGLSDRLEATDTVYVMQALSGG